MVPHLQNICFHLLNHRPYSPDLAPSDFHLFAYLKRYLRGSRFDTDSDVIASVVLLFGEQESAFFAAGIESLPDASRDCSIWMAHCVIILSLTAFMWLKTFRTTW